MTQEDKELLLKDLCARLPYKPKIKFSIIGVEGYEVCKLLPELITLMFFNEDADIKPYLRPMSSMTEEEKQEYHAIIMRSQDCSFENGESATTMVNDWLLSKHFDTRGLIPKGLAIEVTEENNPYKN
jgi:hypothetical protein